MHSVNTVALTAHGDHNTKAIAWANQNTNGSGGPDSEHKWPKLVATLAKHKCMDTPDPHETQMNTSGWSSMHRLSD